MGTETQATGTVRRFQHEERAAAPASEVWRLWTDVSTWPGWDTGLERVHLDGPFALGASGALKGVGAPPARFEVTAHEPLALSEISTRLPLGGALVITRRLEAASAGSVRFTHEVHFRGLGGALLAPLLGPRYRRALPKAMARIRAMAEAPR